MAQANQPPKTMSSRLMTMKFMQRAAGAASSLQSSPSTPSQPSAKRQRLSNGSYQSSAGSTPDNNEARAIREALAAEEQKRVDALEREAADRGETKWYLSFHEPSRAAVESPLRVVSAGFSMLDSAEDVKRRVDNDEDEDEVEGPRLRATVQGRRSFGRFNRAVEKTADPDVSSSDFDNSGSDSQDEDNEPDPSDPDGADAMINQVRRETAEKARAERKQKRKAEKAEAERLAAERRKKNVNLNIVQTISGSRRLPGGSVKDMVCFNCNRKGHKASNCPQENRRSQR